MRILSIWIIFYASHGIIGTLGSSSVDCNYDNYDFWAVGYKYRCKVSNNLNISSPESAIIDTVNGAHESGKSNNDEIYFHAENKHIEYFPRGLEKIFTNLTGILILRSQLKEIHQEDLKPYTKLKYFQLTSYKIEVIEDGLFDFQPDIEVIIFDDSKIFHISSTVFDNLSKLTSLSLEGNKCINKMSKNNRTGVLEVIKSVKSNCISPEYIKLDEKLKNLENNYKNMNHRYNATHIENVRSFEAEFGSSKFYNFQSLRERILRIADWKSLLLSDKTQVIDNSIKLMAERLSRMETDSTASKSELNHKIEAQNNQIISMSNKIDERFTQLEADNSASKSELNHAITKQNSQINSMNNKINRIEQMLSDIIKAQNSTVNAATEKQRIQNPWMIIATAVVGFTQTIIFAVILMKFLA